MRICIHFFYSRCFFLASFFDEKIKDPYNDVRSAALEVVANNWKNIYSAEICCFQIFHRFATKYLKAYNMVVAARGGRSGVRECIRTCLALLLPSLSLLLLPSSPLSHLSLFRFLSQKNKHSHSFLTFHIFQTFCANMLQFAIYFVLKIDLSLIHI